jgi:hypothetical protein
MIRLPNLLARRREKTSRRLGNKAGDALPTQLHLLCIAGAANLSYNIYGTIVAAVFVKSNNVKHVRNQKKRK